MTVFALNRTPRSHGLLVAGPRTYAALTATALVFLLPFYYLVVAASRPMAEMAQSPPPLTPGPLLFSNIAKALDQQNIGLALTNSLVVSGAITVSSVLLCTLAGYAFAKLRFRGRGPLFAVAVGTMMIPPSLGVVPLYSLMVTLGLAGSLASVILPSLVAAFGVFFMRQYLVQALPDELLDAAKVDGATALRTVWSVVLPIARPGMAMIETKSGSRASEVDRVLWTQGHRPARVSKFATGMAALSPDLVANRWGRVLHREFDRTNSGRSPGSVPRASNGGLRLTS